MWDFLILRHSHSARRFTALWIIQKWYRGVNLGPIKAVLAVMSGGKKASSDNESVSLSPRLSEVIWFGCVYFKSLTTVIDWQSLLSMSQLPVVMSNKTTALRRPTLHWDFTSLCLSRLAWRLEDFLSESLLFGFQDEIITSHFMIDGDVRSPCRSFFGSSACRCECWRMQIIINVDVKQLFFS